MDEEILSTKRFFQSHDIILSDYWLESCIQWYREEHPDSNYTVNTLHLKVYEQWLLLDLRDVEVPILPPNITQQIKGILNGIFSLQMLHIIDISRPKLWQIQKLRNSTAFGHTTAGQEYQTNDSGKRMLQVLLTDGIQEIEAIEYRPVNALNVNLAPGIKIKISGPITIRRGQLLLEEKNVNVLGGEVEELLVDNAAENILARTLNMPLNPNPCIIEESLTSANTDIMQSNENTHSIMNSKKTQNENHNQTANRNINFKDKNQQKVNTKSQISARINNNHNISKLQNLVHTSEATVDCITEDDELRIMAEVDMLLEAERDMEEQKHAKNEVNVFEDPHLDTDVVLKIENVTNNKTDVQLASTNGIKGEDSFEIDGSIFGEMDIDAHLDLIDKQVEGSLNKQKSVVLISELLKSRSNITSGKFIVKAKFKSVTQKLTLTNNVWSLKILIADGTGDLETYVCSDIISDLMGYSPSAMMALKEGIVSKDECATTTVLKTIEGLKEKIMQLDCLMEIMFAPHEICPTIINLK